MTDTPWYAQTIEDTLRALSARRNGLTNDAVARSREAHGPNTLPRTRPLRWMTILTRQFRSAFILILLAAAIVSYALGDTLDGSIILLAVGGNIIVGFVQEFQAYRALSTLRKTVRASAHVLRDGNEQDIPIEQVVPGDIIILTRGNRVPADARIIDAHELTVDEAPLTGESAPIEKRSKRLTAPLPLGDRSNLVHLGTTVIDGRGHAVAVATGAATELGRIAQLLEETEEVATPLQRRISQFSRLIAWLVLGLAALIMIIGIFTAQPLRDMFPLAVAVAVAAIPEGLAIAVTVILTIGMRRILRRHALVRRLLAAETLGSTTVICADKTGTLTEGNMRVSHIVSSRGELVADLVVHRGNLADQDTLMHAVRIGIVCNDAYIQNEEDAVELEHLEIHGPPTERALVHFGSELGIRKGATDRAYPRLDVIPFDSTRKFMVTLNGSPEQRHYVFAKGSPEAILSRCTSFEDRGAALPLTPNRRGDLQRDAESLSRKGLRLLALAFKSVSTANRSFARSRTLTSDLTFVAFVGLKDPLRAGTPETVAMVARAGIRTVMITGDHQLTAQAIARELGIPAADRNVIDGPSFATLTDDALRARAEELTVYARVTPQDKIRIVQALQAHGEVVAMTGDGVNDAPALKAANIGVAVGSGTDVAKETADIVLLDDNYNTLVAAVREGRVIFDNIRKVILYLMGDGFTEVTLIAGALIISAVSGGFPMPIIAAQILWINLASDGLGHLAMSLEPEERGILREPPRRRDEPIVNAEMKSLIVIVSVITGLVYLATFAFFLARSGDVAWARTIVFTAVAVDSLFYIFSIRTLRQSFLRVNPFRNRWLFVTIVASLLLQLASVYWPPLQRLLQTVPLGWAEWGVIVVLSLFALVVTEMTKWVFRIRHRQAA